MCFVPLVHQHWVMDEDVVSKQHKHIQFQLFPVLLFWNEDVTDKFIKIGSLSILFLSSVSQRETDSVCVALCALLLSSSTVSLKMTSFFYSRLFHCLFRLHGIQMGFKTASWNDVNIYSPCIFLSVVSKPPKSQFRFWLLLYIKVSYFSRLYCLWKYGCLVFGFGVLCLVFVQCIQQND